MPRMAGLVEPSEMRRLRLVLQLSQVEFAQRLGISAETYRAWDSGRRAAADVWLDKGRPGTPCARTNRVAALSGVFWGSKE
jgi:DNA-binding XRE family transcriptional regulator